MDSDKLAQYKESYLSKLIFWRFDPIHHQPYISDWVIQRHVQGWPDREK